MHAARLDEVAIANLGIGRKFRKPTVIESMTVFENLELAMKGARSRRAALLFRLDASARARFADTIAVVGPASRDDTLAPALADDIAVMDRREIVLSGRALSADPLRA